MLLLMYTLHDYLLWEKVKIHLFQLYMIYQKCNGGIYVSENYFQN